MKGVFLWTLGGAAAFLATAGAFLLLASLGSSSETSSSIPPAERADTGPSPSPALLLDLPEERLAELERAPGQRLALDVVNRGDEVLSGVELELEVVPADTTQPRQHIYREVPETLAPGEATTVEFELDLSVSLPMETVRPGTDDPRSREILQLSAAAPGVASVVKTAVLVP